ncbi:MAG: YceH family protein [Steroidobacter sp.]
MNIHLNPTEARVIGCLIEKAITTPDQYPLSVNSLTNACNQKSNRDPVMDLNERTVQETIDGLVRKHLVLEKSGFGSRVPKYQHRFCNTGFGTLEFSPQETAILCELLVRGPQTPGELRTRASRMAEVHDVSEIETALQNLASRADGPFVVRLPRESGRRDSRYAHLFSGEIEGASADEIAEQDAALNSSPRSEATSSGPRASALQERIQRLEEQVAQLRIEIDQLKSSG